MPMPMTPLTTTAPVPATGHRSEPTGPQWGLLRRMRRGDPILSVRASPGMVACSLAGHDVPVALVAGLERRDLVAERPVGDTSSEYVLTAAGEVWANRQPEGQPS